MHVFLNKFTYWSKYTYYWGKSLLRLLQKRSKKMKLAAIYNVFDGEELLLYSIKNIRSKVDYIIVSYQTMSNHGELAPDTLEPFIKELLQKKLVDEIWCYQPNLKLSPGKNEKIKRNHSQRLALLANCTHFIHMDADEFYIPDEFAQAKQYIQQHGIKSSAVSIIEYLKSPRYEILNGYTISFEFGRKYMFYAPFIMALVPSLGTYFPVLSDQTRRSNGHLRFWLFPKHIIALHHFSTLRRNLTKKYNNSSLNDDKKNIQVIDKIQPQIINWQFEQNQISEDLALFNELVIKRVPNIFNLPEKL